jgi:hypothetical protein
MTAFAKRIVVRFFNALGLNLRRLRPATPARDSMAGGLAQLARLGFQPTTVIDAGVSREVADDRTLGGSGIRALRLVRFVGLQFEI